MISGISRTSEFLYDAVYSNSSYRAPIDSSDDDVCKNVRVEVVEPLKAESSNVRNAPYRPIADLKNHEEYDWSSILILRRAPCK